MTHLRPGNQIEKQHTQNRITEKNGSVCLNAQVKCFTKRAQSFAADHPRKDIRRLFDVNVQMRIILFVQVEFLCFVINAVFVLFLRMRTMKQKLTQTESRILDQLTQFF